MSVASDILRTAKLMMNQYGEYAITEAAERADWLLKHGDTDSVVIWREVCKTVEELQHGSRAREMAT